MKRFLNLVVYILTIHVSALLIAGLFRLVLFISSYHQLTSEALSDKTLPMLAFVHGVWFDNVIGCYILLLPLVVAVVCGVCNYYGKALFRFFTIFFSVFYGLVYLISASDIPYFAYFFKHINSSIFEWFGYAGTTAGMILGESAYYLSIGLFLVLQKLHELKNKYNEELKQILVMYTDNEDGDKIASSIEVLEAKVRSTGEKRFCKNMIVNAVLEDKDRIIKQNGIKAEYSVKAGENTNISNLHLCSIFSNILNNAINACLEIEDKSKRFISVKCDYSGDYMNVLVKNSADKNQKKKIRSSEHGWGMKILEDIAQQYNGRLEYGFKDGIYSTMVSLVYTNNQEESI